jgi:hypothetical protein
MRKAVVTIRRVRRKTDYDIGVTGARIGHIYFRFTDISSLRIHRRFLIGRKVAVISTDAIDYRVHASTDNVDGYLTALQSSWVKFREELCTSKSV